LDINIFKKKTCLSPRNNEDLQQTNETVKKNMIKKRTYEHRQHKVKYKKLTK